MNKKLLAAGLVVFAPLPAFAKTEPLKLIVLERNNFAAVDSEKFDLLEKAGIFESKGELVTVNLEALNALIQFRRAQNKPSALPTDVMDIISNSAVVCVPYGNT